jgi:cell wall-associated NlpC family hydrolase
MTEPLNLVPAAPQPGDVLVMAGTSPADKLIEEGAVLAGQPAASHVAVYHHTTAGVPWAIEGRPGGVGWADARRYLADPRTVTNVLQPKNANQRQQVCDLAVKLLGTPYAWVGGIAEDAFKALHLPQLWAENDATGLAPAHVVCSSLAAWVYGKAGLAAPHPADWQHVTPGDWAAFVLAGHW